jgi:hypothetical protein
MEEVIIGSIPLRFNGDAGAVLRQEELGGMVTPTKFQALSVSLKTGPDCGGASHTHEALYSLTTTREAVSVNQVLADAHLRSATTQAESSRDTPRWHSPCCCDLSLAVSPMARSRSTSLARFGGLKPQPSGARSATPTTRKYPSAISRRSSIAHSIRRSNEPSRPPRNHPFLLHFIQDIAPANRG